MPNFLNVKRQLPHKKTENHFRTSRCKDVSTQRANRIGGKCTRLSLEFGNQLNLWSTFRTRFSVPEFGISKSAWFINHLETISKAYVRILGQSIWNQKEYLKIKPTICPPSASTSAPKHLTQTAISPLLTQKTFESTVPKVSWQQEVQRLANSSDNNRDK